MSSAFDEVFAALNQRKELYLQIYGICEKKSCLLSFNFSAEMSSNRFFVFGKTRCGSDIWKMVPQCPNFVFQFYPSQVRLRVSKTSISNPATNKHKGIKAKTTYETCFRSMDLASSGFVAR